MRIGLVRHYKVNKQNPRKLLVSTDEALQWFREYDESDIEPGETDLGGIDWEHCYSSDQKRAIHTAQLIYEGTISQTEVLREIPLPPLRVNIKLPFMLWVLLLGLSRHTNRQARAVMETAKLNINRFLDELTESGRQNVLIVSHGALMAEFRKELKRRGFRSPRFTYPENGKLYIFER